MSPDDLRLRNDTYRLFVSLGRAPTVGEVADAFGATDDAVRDGWRRLHAAHALVLDDGGTSIRMANPFSGVPTEFRVQAAGRSGSPTAPGTPSGSARPCTATGGSTPRAPTAVTR